ncbi:MAG TPA: TerC family protein, partial [Bacteroidia bacterium]|nr:TerC family protein [Bacteroidia bacterium]
CSIMNIAQDFQLLFSLHGLASLIILFSLELVLGVDNIIFISLVIARLPEGKRLPARIIGLSLALLMRLIMLFALVWLSKTTTVLFTIKGFSATIHDLLFLIGGAYLIWNTIKELREHITKTAGVTSADNQTELIFGKAILQIVMVDILFSFDSIFTAIGLLQNFVIMALAIILSMVCMLYVSGKVSTLINKYPTIKTLALIFIIAVGIMLLASAFHVELAHHVFNVI